SPPAPPGINSPPAPAGDRPKRRWTHCGACPVWRFQAKYSPMAKVLLVDDDLTMVQMVAELLRQEGHEVFPFSQSNAAVAGLTTHAPVLVITDLYFDKTRAHGLEVVQKARSMAPPAVVIVSTGFGTIETAVDAMKHGAFDYLEKPFKVDELKLCVQRALSYNAAVSETAYLRKQLKKKYEFS